MKYIINSFLFVFLFVGIVRAQDNIPKPTYSIKTYRDNALLGEINIELFPLIAPLHVANFDTLVSQKLYDSTAFHRVVPGFVIQGGDPNSISGPRSTWGQGNPNQEKVEAEFSSIAYVRGIMGAARSTDINSATSQFFFTVAPARNLDEKYTAYGKVISGMAIVDTIVNAPADGVDNPFKKIAMVITKTGENNEIPMTPVLKTPIDSLKDVDNFIILRWDTIDGAVLYNVEVSEKSDFSDPLEISTVGGISYRLNEPSAAKRYYWRVSANNGGAMSPYSAVRTFTTKGFIEVGIRNYTLADKIKTRANGTEFDISLAESEQLQFILTDISGKEIYIEQLDLSVGLTKYKVKSTGLTAGIYMYSFAGKNGRISGKCILFN